jgi:hypothetical protein
MEEHTRYFSDPSTGNDLAVTENERFLKVFTIFALPYLHDSKNGDDRMILRLFKLSLQYVKLYSVE